MQVNIVDGAFVLDAALIGELLDIPAADVAALMRSQTITSVCETGVDADEGTFRLNLFYGARHARLRVDATGRILQRSIIDFGQRPLPRARRAAVKAPSCNPSAGTYKLGSNTVQCSVTSPDQTTGLSAKLPLRG